MSNLVLEQHVAIETIARWSELFLRASLLDDQGAFNYVYQTGDALDSHVTVISQQIPESSSWVVPAILGISGVVAGFKKMPNFPK